MELLFLSSLCCMAGRLYSGSKVVALVSCVIIHIRNNLDSSPVARAQTRKSDKVQGFLMVLGSHQITDEI